MMVDSPLIKKMRDRARELGTRTLEDLMAAEGGVDALGVALKGAQGGRRAFDEQAGRVLGGMGLATQSDLERVSRKMGRLRKRMLALLEKMEDRDGGGAEDRF